MTFNEMVLGAVTPIVPVCVPDILVQEAGESVPDVYCVFSAADSAALYGDDEPDGVLYRGNLMLVLPRTANPSALKRRLRRALLDADCACGAWMGDADETTQTWSLSLEWLGEEG